MNYVLNEEKMFADITDGVAIVINSETGVYYGMNGFGTAVFENIINGASTEDVLAQLKTLAGCPADIEARFNAFVKALVDNSLLVEGSGSAPANISADKANEDGWSLEVKEYNDAQELLLADPIHEVKEETGWAPDKSVRWAECCCNSKQNGVIVPKVSVIIPVYNAQAYLRQCLDSVINQTLTGIEIICVNDCSPDNSFEILKEYEPRVKIINFEQNRGVSAARNAGIDEATGEYIAFVDSDDYLAADFYEKLYKLAKATDADVAKGAYFYETTNNTHLQYNKEIRRSKFAFCCEFASAIYRREFLNENNLRFPPLTDMEDPVFSLNVAIKANKVETDDTAIYNVTLNPNSVTRSTIKLAQAKDKVAGLDMMFKISEDLEPQARDYIRKLYLDNLPAITGEATVWAHINFERLRLEFETTRTGKAPAAGVGITSQKNIAQKLREGLCKTASR